MSSHPSTPPLAARMALGFLERLQHGQLQLQLPDGSQRLFGQRNPSGQAEAATDATDATADAVMIVSDWNAFSRILRDGDIGFAEAFMDGQWHTPHLPALLCLLAANRQALDAPLYGSWIGRLLHRLTHLLRSNTRAGARRNIAAHYDLGNEFYALWLDAGMTYSAGVFTQPDWSLSQAQDEKYRRVLEQLQLAPASRVLEIGCGWGGFAERCVGEGHHLTGLTLSQRQLDYARARLQPFAAQVDLTRVDLPKIDLQLRDYRDLGRLPDGSAERYDAVVSIEMIEAVGERWWPSYFERIASVLPGGGRAVIQAILIDDALFERYRRGSDFIQQYIFPGGMLPSLSRFTALAEAAGLQLVQRFHFAEGYARTLALWRERVLATREQILAMGFDTRFLRMWEFYLAYCEAGFRSGSTDVAQLTLERR